MVTEAICQPIEILLAEDNPGDVLLTREALARIHRGRASG